MTSLFEKGKKIGGGGGGSPVVLDIKRITDHSIFSLGVFWSFSAILDSLLSAKIEVEWRILS